MTRRRPSGSGEQEEGLARVPRRVCLDKLSVRSRAVPLQRCVVGSRICRSGFMKGVRTCIMG